MFPHINLQISTKAKKQEGIQNLQFGNILPSHFLWFIVGKPGSGKSTLIQQLLLNKQLYFQKFDTVLFLSPSDFTNFDLNSDNVCKDFNIEWLFQKVTQLQQESNAQQSKINKNVLIIIDDFISQLGKMMNMPVISQLFFNRRHIIPNTTISIIVTAQKYTTIPARIRSIGDTFSFFSLNQRDWQLAKDELIFYDNMQQCSQIIQNIFNQSKHDFVYIRTQPFILAQNFRPLIYEGAFHPFSEDKEEQQVSQQAHSQSNLAQSQQINHNPQQLKKMSFFSK